MPAEHQGVGVHRRHCLVPGQDAGHHDDRRPDDGYAGAVHAEDRKPAEGQAEIGAGERHQRDHPFDGYPRFWDMRWSTSARSCRTSKGLVR